MEPTIEKILQGIPYAGMGSTLERNALIGVIKSLIEQDKFTVDYILNYVESVGYQRQMAEDVFKELTGLSPKLIVNNNEYYKMPNYVPNMCIAWGLHKSKKDFACYVVPWDYGYCVMEKDENNAPVVIVETATIPEAIDELKKVAKNIQTLDKIITSKLLETEDIQCSADEPNQTQLPYSSSPLKILKKNFKDKVLSGVEFERQARKLLAEDKITVDEAEDLMLFKQDLEEKDESYANDTLQLDEEWKPLEGKDIDLKNIKIESIDLTKPYEETQNLLWNSDTKADFLVDIILSRIEDMEKFDTFMDIGNKFVKETTDENFEDKLNDFINDCAKIGINIIISNNRKSLNKKQSSKKVTAENMTIDDIEEEDNKDEVQEEIDKINDTPVEELLVEETPIQYFDNAVQEDKVDTINEVVSKCIDKFSEKFADFDKYTVKILSYNTKVLGDYAPNKEEMVEDKEINANAILQIILAINNNADDKTIKKALAVFSITNGKLHWSGTIRGENDQIVAFTEEGIDNLFEVEEVKEDELEDII